MLIRSACHSCERRWLRPESSRFRAAIFAIATRCSDGQTKYYRRNLTSQTHRNSQLASPLLHDFEPPPSSPSFTPAHKLEPRPIPLASVLRRHDDTFARWTRAYTFDDRLRPTTYLQLSKARLTLLVTITSVGGLMMAPGAVQIPILWSCIAGTALMSASANAFNQWLEAPYDAQMRRTQSRVLVTGKLAPSHAFTFGVAVGLYGMCVLWSGCNPMTASLGALNVLLYACVYTPLKRLSIGCTWAGAVVGAIPPLMGYSAGTGGTIDAAALVLAAVIYSWQFPHFNGLSWNLRGDYSRAGYRVMCVTAPMLCRATSLRHSIALVGLCSLAAPLSQLTTWTFAGTSLPLNACMVYLAHDFYRNPDATTSRRLFKYTLVYLPALMLLMIASRQPTRSDANREQSVAGKVLVDDDMMIPPPP